MATQSRPLPPRGFFYPQVQTSQDGHTLRVLTDAQHRPSVWLQRKNGTSRLVHEGAVWPLWSPLGDRFILLAPRRPSQAAYPQSVFVYRLDPLTLEKRVDIGVQDYAWSPDGERLVITGRLARDEKAQKPPVAILIVDVGRGVQTVVDKIPWIEDPFTTEWWNPEVPGFSWSPDGRFLVYSRVERTGYDSVIIDADLFVAGADGARRQRLTTTPLVAEQWPRWVARDRMHVDRDHFRRIAPTNDRPLPFQYTRSEEVALRLRSPTALVDAPLVGQGTPNRLVPAAATPTVDVGLDTGWESVSITIPRRTPQRMAQKPLRTANPGRYLWVPCSRTFMEAPVFSSVLAPSREE